MKKYFISLLVVLAVLVGCSSKNTVDDFTTSYNKVIDNFNSRISYISDSAKSEKLTKEFDTKIADFKKLKFDDELQKKADEIIKKSNEANKLLIEASKHNGNTAKEINLYNATIVKYNALMDQINSISQNLK